MQTRSALSGFGPPQWAQIINYRSPQSDLLSKSSQLPLKGLKRRSVSVLELSLIWDPQSELYFLGQTGPPNIISFQGEEPRPLP